MPDGEKPDAMKNRSIASSPNASRAGFAIVLVLAILFLLSGLILPFFSMAVSERKSTSAFRSEANAQDLARLGADVVVAQIRAATTGTTPDGLPTTWASQPGAIRTYAATSKPGDPATKIYKLYSSGTMSVDGIGFTGTSETPPADWADHPGLYADLNRPVNKHYPIADPTLLSGSAAVQGFEVTGTNFLVDTNGDGTTDLPMPARWLYVLQDGSVVPAAKQTGNIVSVPAASGTNPVVGRIAFWADDESAKVNVNTAGGDIWANTSGTYSGSFWSPPYATSEFDKQKLAMAQPYQKEYQRYPGHPGTVHLSAVFPDLTLEQLMSLTPRYQFGGSMGGTVEINAGASAIASKKERLYATVDELIYNPDRQRTTLVDASRLEETRFFLTANSRSSDLNLFGLPKVSAWPIHRKTGAQYRTPYDELIAFCTTLKPEGGTPAEYFFSRNSANDPAGDFNTRNGQLYDYLGDLLGRNAPGFGGNGTLAGKWTSNERWQILTEVYDYIRSTNLKDTSTATILPYAMDTPALNPTPESLGFGQVVPTQLTRNGVQSCGFGRFPIISEIGFMIVKCPPPAGAADAPTGYNRMWCQAMILLELNSPAHGFDLLGLNTTFDFTGLDRFQLAGKKFVSGTNSYTSKVNGQPAGTFSSIGFPSTASLVLQQYSGRGLSSGTIGFYPRGWGGVLSPLSLLIKDNSNTPKTLSNSTGGPDVYPLVSDKFYIDSVHAWTATPPATSGSDANIDHLVLGFSGCNIAVTQKAGTGNQYQKNYTFSFPSIGGTASTATAYDMMRGPMPNSAALSATANALSAPVEIADLIKDPDPRVFLKDTAAITAPVGTPPISRLVIRSLQPDYGAGAKADLRHYLAASESYGYKENGSYNSGNSGYPCQHGFQAGDGITWGAADLAGTNFYFSVGYTEAKKYNGIYCTSKPNFSNLPGVPLLYKVTNRDGNPGDWDTGIGPFSDGAYINKPDDGSTLFDPSATTAHDIYREPYFRNYGGYQSLGTTYFSPNRILPSPAMFGSLSSGINRGRPWETLLFTPGPAAGANHPGLKAGTAPDHLLLDLFHMPVVDPYAISEPFSTAGRVNLNTQILPFTYIRRDTALRAALRGVRVPVISADVNSWTTSDPFQYKMSRGAGGLYGGVAYSTTNNRIYQRPIDLDTTMDGFQKRMLDDNLFRSATQICDMFLVPDLRSAAGEHFLNSGVPINTGTYDAVALRDFWTATGDGLKWSGLTGDNLRERPYALLYPLVTTKSNTFTVHVIAQVLKSPSSTPAGQFVERADAAKAEWQGSFLIERQLSSTDKRLVDYASRAATDPKLTAEPLHKIRILQTRRFNPAP